MVAERLRVRRWLRSVAIYTCLFASVLLLTGLLLGASLKFILPWVLFLSPFGSALGTAQFRKELFIEASSKYAVVPWLLSLAWCGLFWLAFRSVNQYSSTGLLSDGWTLVVLCTIVTLLCFMPLSWL
jgi:hypothetical protein